MLAITISYQRQDTLYFLSSYSVNFHVVEYLQFTLVVFSPKDHRGFNTTSTLQASLFPSFEVKTKKIKKNKKIKIQFCQMTGKAQCAKSSGLKTSLW